MKNLKFLIFTLGLFVAPVMFGVTLPSTSYSGGDSYSAELYDGGSVMSGSFMMLGVGEDPQKICVGPEAMVPPGGYRSCSACCDYYFPTEGDPNYDTCMDACTKGPFLPLDAPLWYMLAIAVLGAAFSVALRKRLA